MYVADVAVFTVADADEEGRK